jgi:hypothetical protein
MKQRRLILWTLLGGLPICAIAAIWAEVISDANSDPAWAQTAGVSSAEVSEDKPVHTEATAPARADGQGSPPAPRQAMRDFLRWEALTPDQRRLDRQMQFEDEATEWSKLLEFLRTNSHNRYLLILHVGPQPGSPLRNRLMQRWLTVEVLQRTDPALYDIHVQEFREEDVVIGLAAEMRRARRAGDSDRLQDLRSQVRQSATKLVELNFDERELRIQDAQRLLDQEKARLDTDRAQKDHLVDERSRALMQQFGFPLAVRNYPTTRPDSR